MESLGLDRLLKSNTSKRRTHSLFRQGCLLYDLIPTRHRRRLEPGGVEDRANARAGLRADPFGAVVEHARHRGLGDPSPGGDVLDRELAHGDPARKKPIY